MEPVPSLILEKLDLPITRLAIILPAMATSLLSVSNSSLVDFPNSLFKSFEKLLMAVDLGKLNPDFLRAVSLLRLSSINLF